MTMVITQTTSTQETSMQTDWTGSYMVWENHQRGVVSGYKDPRPEKGDRFEACNSHGDVALFEFAYVDDCFSSPGLFFGRVEPVEAAPHTQG